MSTLAAPLLMTALLADATALERRLWEVAVRKFEKIDQTADYPDDSVLFFGSSSIRLWDTIETDMAPYPVIQRGYGGARLSDAVGFVERVVYPHEFSALVLFVANDLRGHSSDRSPEEVAALFDEVLAKVRAKYPTTPVFWVEVTPTPSRWAAYDFNRQAADLIRQTCDADPNAYYVMTAERFLIASDDGPVPNGDLFRSDRLHLNSEGYAIWAKTIKAELNRVLPPPSSQPTIPVSIKESAPLEDTAISIEN